MGFVSGSYRVAWVIGRTAVDGRALVCGLYLCLFSLFVPLVAIFWTGEVLDCGVMALRCYPQHMIVLGYPPPLFQNTLSLAFNAGKA